MESRLHRAAFTLVELLVVMAIIGVLVSLLLPAVQKVREAANRTTCQNNLKQIGLALHHYHDTYLAFPPGYRASVAYRDGATDTAPGWGWEALLLPYVEQENVYRAIQLDLPIEAPPNAPAVGNVIKTYLCPSDLAPLEPFPVPDGFGQPVVLAGPSSYAACVGGDESDTTAGTGRGVFYRDSRTRFADIMDGTSSTILIGERAWANANGVWAGAVSEGVCRRGAQNTCPGAANGSSPAATLVQAHSHLNNTTTDADGGLDDFSSRHPAGSNILFADGAVHFIRSVPGDLPDGGYTADSLIFQALGTRAGAEVVPADWVN